MISWPWQNKKRLLGFWDFKSSNHALGSFVEFEAGLVCAAVEYNLKKIDLALVYDSNKPVGHSKFSTWISSGNFHYHLLELLHLVYLIPQLGSIFVFNSHKEFEEFYLKNKDKYQTYPSYADYTAGISSLLKNMEFIKKFYEKHHYLPSLISTKTSQEWARAFIKEYCGGKYAIAVTIRLNNHQSSARNSDPRAWKFFFEYCRENYPDVVFLVLGRKDDQVKQEFGDFSNLIFPKDFGANIEQDAALIENCCFFMATMSGLASYVVFSTKISYVLSKYLPPYKHDLSEGDNMPWQNKEFQHLLWGEEDGNLLIEKFNFLFSKINKSEWLDKIKNSNRDFLNWPYKSR